MVVRTLLEVLDVAARERDADFVDLGGGHGGTGRVVFLFTLSDVTHPCSLLESQKVTEGLLSVRERGEKGRGRIPEGEFC